MDLGKLEPGIVEFLEAREDRIRPNVLRQSLGQIKANPLHGRAITRDLDWGIPVPVEGWEGKCLYVWFEAVIGYLSATDRVGAAHMMTRMPGTTGGTTPRPEAYYFIGKDNIPFHAVMWPAQLSGAGEWFGKIFEEKDDTHLTLPYDVPANEFMNMQDQKLSGSRGWAVWGLDFLSRYDPDALRFYLTINMPETKDSNWDWDDFVTRNNSQLVATWGNLANRVLSFAHKHWEGHIPTPGELTSEDQAVLDTVETGFETIGELLDQVKLRAALIAVIGTGLRGKQVSGRNCPLVRGQRQISSAPVRSSTPPCKPSTISRPSSPPSCPSPASSCTPIWVTSEPLFGEQFTQPVTDAQGEHITLQYKPGDAAGKWAPTKLEPGKAFLKPSPLYQKLDPIVAEEERARLG